jgi:L-malate glycosyltransferase
VNILHAHSTFTLGGKEARAVRLMNAFGDQACHTILSAMPGALAARAAIDPGIAVDFPSDHPPLVGKPALGRYRDLARYMAGFDLVLTYNWGSMDAVGARRLFGRRYRVPPLVHHEDGFNEDEALRLNWKRNLFRSLTLDTAYALVVPSRKLEAIALSHWRMAPGDVRRIANGINLDRLARAPEPGSIPGLERRPNEVIVGTVAGLRAVKNLPRLVRAFAPSAALGRLVIVGEGPEKAAIAAEAERLGIGDRVLLPGFLADPARYMGHFDIFALSSESEQFPIALIEAMAAGLPAVSTAVGDVAAMLSQANPPPIPVSDEAGLAFALHRLMSDSVLRRAAGEANRAKAQAEYSEADMIAAYADLYSAAAGHPGAIR